MFLVIGVVATELLHFAPVGSTRLWKATRAVKRKFAVANRRAGGGAGRDEAKSLLGNGRSRSGSRERDDEGSLILRRQESAELGHAPDEEDGWAEEDELEEDSTVLEETDGEEVVAEGELDGSVLSVRGRPSLLPSFLIHVAKGTD